MKATFNQVAFLFCRLFLPYLCYINKQTIIKMETVQLQEQDLSKLPFEEILALIKAHLKEYKGWKFSVRKGNGGWTSSLRINIMSAPEPILIEHQDNLQINYHGINENKKIREEIKPTLMKLVNFVQKHNYDNSDSMTDYFDVGFYFTLEIGKWDKGFIVKPLK